MVVSNNSMIIRRNSNPHPHNRSMVSRRRIIITSNPPGIKMRVTRRLNTGTIPMQYAKKKVATPPAGY